MLSLLLSAALSTTPAQAAAPPRLLRLAGGLGAGGAPAAPAYAEGVSSGGHVLGRAQLQVGRWAGDLAVREGLYAGDLRSVGSLFAGVRLRVGDSPWSLRGGFAHHHEVADEVLVADPVAAVAGTAEGIRHRSGLEVGAAWRAPLPFGEPDRFGVSVEPGVAWLPDDGGPVVYGFLDVVFTVDVGPRVQG